MLSTKRRGFQVFLACVCDVAALGLSFAAAYWIRFSFISAPRGIPPITEYAKALLVVVPIYLWVFRSYRLYDLSRHTRRVEEIFIVLKAIVMGSMILMALTFFYRTFSYSRLFLVILSLCACFLVSLARYLLIQWQYHARRQDKDIHRILVVGANRNARRLIEWTKQNLHLGYRVEGVLAKKGETVGKHFEDVPVVGTLEEYGAAVERYRPNEVIVADPDIPKERIADMLLQCEDGLVSFKVAADLYGVMTTNLDMEYIAAVPLLGPRDLPLDDPWNRIVKRTFDLLMASGLLVLCFSLMILAALAIKLTDGRKVFYAQERVGQDGKRFLLYKFRTMKPDAEAKTGPVWTKRADSRCTAVGTWLRRFNLDELPQLWNVVRGDMSLVGPRPERPHFVNQFRSEVPRYMARHKIKSGITGWAQVNGLRGNTSIQERLKYDLYYAENWSILFDVEILFMTIFAFKNAY